MQLKTCFKSSPNIALIKYWGKYHEKYILPINDSIGLTLNPKDFHTKTQVTFSQKQNQDKLILNGKQHKKSKRLENLFRIVRQKARKKHTEFTDEDWNKHHFFIESTNSFPTASGMASSASGLACLASALNALFGNIFTSIQLSQLARFGSGSASRSIFGGLVRWRGVPKWLIFNSQEQLSENHLQKLSKQCISFSIRDQNKLSFIKIICLLATNEQKQVSSTDGMKLSVQTSELINYRNQIALKRIENIEKCLDKIQQCRKDNDKVNQYEAFNKFCQIVIKDSNQFHAICLDTYPPIFYLNQFSKQVIEIVDHFINKTSKINIAYTFDAGPHAFLFVHEDNAHEVFDYLQQTFNITQEQLNQHAKKQKKQSQGRQKVENFKKYTKQTQRPYALWTTDVGPGSKPYDINETSQK